MRRLKRPIMRHGISLPPLCNDVSAERLDGNFPLYRHGDNVALPNGVWETIYPVSTQYTWPTAAALLDILSSSPNDDGAPLGTGAQTVYIWGLNGSYRPISEIVTLNGVAAVQTTNEYLRVQGIKVMTVGTVGWNVGNISVQDLANTYTLCYIPAEAGRRNGAFWTVPKGKTLYITQWMAGESAAQVTDFAIRAREPGGVFGHYKGMHLRNQALHMPLHCPLRFDEKTDIELIGRTTGQSDGNACASFQGWYEPSEGNLTQDR